jgi:hypothetical protein
MQRSANGKCRWGQLPHDAYRACKQLNSNLLLNLSPDTSERLPDDAIKTLREVRELIHN